MVIHDEQSPLLRQSDENGHGEDEPKSVDFSKDDPDNPRQWKYSKKMANVLIIALMSVLTPLASSMFTPGASQIAKDFGVSQQDVVGTITGFVVMIGVGPLVLAPLSETFGRRPLYITCFSLFTLLQIPTALSPNLAVLITLRVLAGFFGSIGIANGAGTINDMFVPSERSGIFGWYLLGPLLGPTVGPLLGGIIIQELRWRWVFWILLIISGANTLAGIVFLRETYVPKILSDRCQHLKKEQGGEYTYEGEDRRPLHQKILSNLQRPIKILFTQPIVFIFATYQALTFATMYSLFVNMEEIFGQPPYNFTITQVGLLYLGPGIGFVLAVMIIIPQIGKVFNRLSKQNGSEKPEYRLPMANVGAVLLPLSLFWFAWAVKYRIHWFAVIFPTIFFGLGQVSVLNSVQNYYLDAFPGAAASAVAAGALFRSVIGGIVPLVTPPLFNAIGYGWGWSVFAFLCLALAPSILLVMKYGEGIRDRFARDI